MDIICKDRIVKINPKFISSVSYYDKDVRSAKVIVGNAAYVTSDFNSIYELEQYQTRKERYMNNLAGIILISILSSALLFVGMALEHDYKILLKAQLIGKQL